MTTPPTAMPTGATDGMSDDFEQRAFERMDRQRQRRQRDRVIMALATTGCLLLWAAVVLFP